MLPYAAFTSMSSMAAPAVGTPGAVATSGAGSRHRDDSAPSPFGRLGLGAHLGLQRRHLGEQRLLLLRDLLGLVALAQVRGAHERVGLHLGGRAEGDDLTEVEHVDVVARAHHEAHVVLDEQDREPGAGELDEQLGELGGLRLVEPRRRLVEQHDAWLGGQRPRHLDQALRAGGQAVDALLRDRREADALDELVGERHRA